MRDPRDALSAPVRWVLAVVLIAAGIALVVFLETLRSGEIRSPETIPGFLVIGAGIVLVKPKRKRDENQ